jgi:hypothetical protein
MMKAIWQAATLLFLGMASAHAAEEAKEFVWAAPNVVQSIFTPDLGMLDAEREEYAACWRSHSIFRPATSARWWSASNSHGA